MSDFRPSNDLNLTGVAPETTGGLRQRPGRRGLLTKAAVAAVGSGALLAALAIPASASGNPNPWDGAQVGLTYPVYQPKTVLAQPMTSFKLLSCGAGQDESIFATFGKAYTPPSNYGKVVGFSVAEGYPFICANPGVAKQVGVWTVGIPKGPSTSRSPSIATRHSSRAALPPQGSKTATCSSGHSRTNSAPAPRSRRKCSSIRLSSP